MMEIADFSEEQQEIRRLKKIVKMEMADHRKFENRAQAKLEIFDYTEIWCNRKRRYSTLNYFNPV